MTLEIFLQTVLVIIGVCGAIYGMMNFLLKDIYAQLIDDATGLTLVAANSRQKDIAAQSGTKSEKSVMVGKALAEKAVALGLEKCVFDRGGYLYHGRVKSVADGAREGGLKF